MSRDNVQITHHLQQKNLQFIRVFLDKCHKCSSKEALRSSYSSHPMRSQYIDVLDNWHEQQPNINAD
jgi:hemerythrin-like domain-containing protein